MNNHPTNHLKRLLHSHSLYENVQVSASPQPGERPRQCPLTAGRCDCPLRENFHLNLGLAVDLHSGKGERAYFDFLRLGVNLVRLDLIQRSLCLHSRGVT
jgi:hypothetical protein